MLSEKRYLPIWFYIGIIILSALIIMASLKVKFFQQWATPIFWTSYILILDGIIYSFKGKSFLFSIEFIVVFILSILTWWYFEWVNIFLSNWHYTGLPNLLERYIGYIWAFGTIIPSVLITYNLLLLIFRDTKIEFHGIKFSERIITVMILLGILFILLPIIPFSLSFIERSADKKLFFFLEWININYGQYLAFATWTSLFLILDPINYTLQKPSIIGYIEKGNYKVILLLSLTGIICGFLWESVNYLLATTKWYYTVPILENIKIFEMPILGYLGFITFAWEIYDIISFTYKPAIMKIQEWFI
ncbi:MAG: hypothetical protein ACP5PT_04415 [Brevinematia bacterium]